MKICFIVNQLYKPGGIERTISHRVIELSKYHEIFVITMDNGNNEFYFDKSEKVKYIDLNSNFQRKANGSFKKNIANITYSILSYCKLQSTILKIKPDFMVNVVGKHNLMFLPFMVGKGTTILEHHSSIYQSEPNKILKYIFNKYDYHIFLNEEESKAAGFIYKKKYVIPNPSRSNDLEIIPYSCKKKRIVSAGRIVDIKGFDRLIEAWRIIHLEFPDWIIEIYGEPNFEVLAKLNDMIIEYNLVKSFHIKPAISNILEVINDSKIYALTSHFESFSMGLLEAISLETLVVAFDCPTGPRGIIDKDSGYLVENDNIELYAETLKKAILLNNYSSCLASKGYKKSQEFSINKVINKWKGIFTVDKKVTR